MKITFLSIGAVLFFFNGLYAGELLFVNQLAHYLPVSESVHTMLRRIATPHAVRAVRDCSTIDRPLYRAFPGLHAQLLHIDLGDLPTPITRAVKVERYLDARFQIYIKNDGLSGKKSGDAREFGGNKIRKLEFLLADAIDNGARSVMTFGCTGSNHVVATGSLCKQLGLDCIAMLMPQQATEVVLRNKRLMALYGIETIESSTAQLRNLKAIDTFIQKKQDTGHMPYVIPTGGSCALGDIGFVNAAFELKEQIEQGVIPGPDYIYLPAGSCGTMAGLMVGIKAAGLKSQVIGVAIQPDNRKRPYRKKIMALLVETNQLLHEKDNSFPLYEWQESDINLSFDFTGPEYGVPTPEGFVAKKVMLQLENIALDSTYSAKAFAGLINDAFGLIKEGATVLFWNTFCSTAPAIDSSK